MRGGKLRGSANRVGPVEFHMGPVTQPHFLLQHPDQLPGFSRSHQARPLGLPERIEDFHAMPRSPENLGLRLAIEQGDGHRMVGVAATFVRQPQEVSA